MLKKIMSAALSALMCTSAFAAAPAVSAAEVTSQPAGALAESNFGNENNITLKVYANDKAVSLVKKQVESFKALYPNKTFKKIEVIAEEDYDGIIEVLIDPANAADVFTVTSDQLLNLKYAEAELPVKFSNEVKSRDAAYSVSPATYNQNLYGYPLSTGNAYCLVYDKSIVSDTDAKTLEGTLAACKKAGKEFIMDCVNGFYSAAFIFTGGVIIDGFEADEYTQKFKNYDEDEAIATLQAFSKLMHDYKGTFKSLDPAQIASGFINKTLGAGFDGVWNKEADKQALGSRFGAAKLPTIKVNNNNKQIIPFNGLYYRAVNAKTKFPNAANMLAYYLSDEECQKQNAQQLGQVPTNKNLQNSTVVTNDAVMNAVKEQSEFACPQANVQGTFWQAVGNLGEDLIDSNTNPNDKEHFKTLLNNTIADIRDEYDYPEPGTEYPEITNDYSTENGIVFEITDCNDNYGYRIFRKVNGSWKGIGNTTSKTFTDTNVKYNEENFYTVRAIDKNGKLVGDYDDIGYYTWYEAVYPDILSLKSNSGGITLNWEKIDGVSTYRLYYKNEKGGWSVLKSVVNGTTFTDSNVKFGQKKTYTVRALNKKGQVISDYDRDGWSATYSVATPQISSLSSGENGITIKWNAVSGASKYRVYYKSGNSWKTLKDVTGTSTTDSAVKYGRKETYTVRAINNKGEVMSGYNSTGKSTTYAVATPKITSLKNNSSGVVIKWNKVSSVSSYRIYYKNAKGGWSVLSKSYKGDTYTDKSVKNGTKKTYTIRALDKKGNTISDYNRTGWSIVYKK